MIRRVASVLLFVATVAVLSGIQWLPIPSSAEISGFTLWELVRFGACVAAIPMAFAGIALSRSRWVSDTDATLHSPFWYGWVGVALVIGMVTRRALIWEFNPEMRPECVPPAVDTGLNAITSLLVGPVAEEVVFRAQLFSLLSDGRRGGIQLKAILTSTVFFTVYHQWYGMRLENIGIFAEIALFGLLLSWIYGRTNSLAWCSVVHVLHNCLTVAYYFVHVLHYQIPWCTAP